MYKLNIKDKSVDINVQKYPKLIALQSWNQLNPNKSIQMQNPKNMFFLILLFYVHIALMPVAQSYDLVAFIKTH